ncbi:hypothetical protein NPIL_283601 [Nephila pilipes]|uniref:Uncharacterized protein n=1 Tax=Nephila pilipes TaxID=299642 RepID=A0A8X6P0I9_NEPPI|nr:hypothetical protein NPIL_283601 [Nephila pilipes]
MQELLDDCAMFSLRRQKREVGECDDNSIDGEGCLEVEPKPEAETTSFWNLIYPGKKNFPVYNQRMGVKTSAQDDSSTLN